MITCPTCMYQYNLSFGDVTGYYHETLIAADIRAQETRCHVFRDECETLDHQLLDVSDSDPLSGDMNFPSHLCNPVELSDSSLDITSSASDINDEYSNTQYYLVTMRLAKLIRRKYKLETKLLETTGRARDRKRSAKPEKDEERKITIFTEKSRRRTERHTLIQNRKLRMLAVHGAQLDEKKVVVVKKKKKDGEVRCYCSC
jgi:hypothetical protein